MAKSRSLVKVGLGAAAAALVITAAVHAAGEYRPSNAAGEAAFSGVIPKNLPPVERGAMTVTPVPGKALSVLSFDDGTCEGGLGVGNSTGAIEYLNDYDVPAQCTTGGLSIRGVSARLNTASGILNAVALRNATASPASAALQTAGVAAFNAAGPCPSTGTPIVFENRTVATGALMVDNTVGFFAGVTGPGGGFMGRDATAPQGRMWLGCLPCGMPWYSPAALSGFALGGNWAVRVTVEDANCVPVELTGFSIE